MQFAKASLGSPVLYPPASDYPALLGNVSLADAILSNATNSMCRSTDFRKSLTKLIVTDFFASVNLPTAGTSLSELPTPTIPEILLNATAEYIRSNVTSLLGSGTLRQ